MDAGAYGFEHHTASDEHFPSGITSAAEWLHPLTKFHSLFDILIQRYSLHIKNTTSFPLTYTKLSSNIASFIVPSYPAHSLLQIWQDTGLQTFRFTEHRWSNKDMTYLNAYESPTGKTRKIYVVSYLFWNIWRKHAMMSNGTTVWTIFLQDNVAVEQSFLNSLKIKIVRAERLMISYFASRATNKMNW